MGKSIRSKAKRAFRSKKRETGVYAATEAARLHRLNAKLVSVASADKEGDVPVEDVEEGEDEILAQESNTKPMSIEPMAVDGVERISTHGPRGSRREEWRRSKGLVARPAREGVNRQGLIVARRRAGRSKRRR